MQQPRLRTLVLSELFPTPATPALGIFVERQAAHLQRYCDNVVVAPTRVFPHLQLWRQILRPRRFLAGWKQWRAELRRIPLHTQISGMPVFYPRYTSPPKQFVHGLWGFFAYVFVQRQLHALHQEQRFDLI